MHRDNGTISLTRRFGTLKDDLGESGADSGDASNGNSGDASSGSSRDASSGSSRDAPVDGDDRGRDRVRRIVLTGGPGGGKSTVAAFLAREFASELWVLPEAATLLYRGGLPRGDDERGVSVAQRAIFTVQRSLEHAHGLQHPHRLQVCDRGTIDGAAYWPAGSEAFFRTMRTTHELELARYDAVIFLHTAATLPAGYERDLEVRTELRADALELDRRMFALYRDHANLVAVQSTASFLEKLNVVVGAVRDLTRVPASA